MRKMKSTKSKSDLYKSALIGLNLVFLIFGLAIHATFWYIKTCYDKKNASPMPPVTQELVDKYQLEKNKEALRLQLVAYGKFDHYFKLVFLSGIKISFVLMTFFAINAIVLGVVRKMDRSAMSLPNNDQK